MNKNPSPSNASLSHGSRPSRQRMSGLIPSIKTAPSRLASVLPLPGLQELKLVAEALVHGLQKSPEEQVRRSALAFKITSIVELLAGIAHLEYQHSHLQHEVSAIKKAFDEMFDGSPLDFQKSERNVEIFDVLNQRVDFVIELIKLRLRLNTVPSYDTEQVPVISAHEIIDQALLPIQKRQLGGSMFQIVEDNGSYGPGDTHHITVCRRSGRIGRTPVTYITYASKCSIEAEKRIRDELEHYSQSLHPNIATVIGITRSLRLNGIVLVSGALPFHEFLQRTNDPFVMAKSLQEYYAAWKYFNGQKEEPQAPFPKEVQANLDGHVVVTPTRNFAESINMTYARNLVSTRDPVTKLILQELNTNHRSITELQLLCIIKDTNIKPPDVYLGWQGVLPPPFIMLTGDVGKYTGESHSITQWLPLKRIKLQQPKDRELLFYEIGRFSTGAKPLHQESLPNSADWLTYQIHRDFSLISWLSTAGGLDQSEWKETVAFWINQSKITPEIGIQDIHLCNYYWMCITVLQKGSLHDAEEVYFHRRATPQTKSDADFWGYLSTNINPNDRDYQLKDRGWELRYELRCSMIRVADDWAYRYDQLLERTMRNTPGSFLTLEEELDESQG